MTRLLGLPRVGDQLVCAYCADRHSRTHGNHQGKNVPYSSQPPLPYRFFRRVAGHYRLSTPRRYVEFGRWTLDAILKAAGQVEALLGIAAETLFEPKRKVGIEEESD